MLFTPAALILDVLVSDLDTNIDSPDLGVSWFSHLLQTSYGTTFQIRPRPLFPHPAQITDHYSFYHLTVCSLSYRKLC